MTRKLLSRVGGRVLEVKTFLYGSLLGKLSKVIGPLSVPYFEIVPDPNRISVWSVLPWGGKMPPVLYYVPPSPPCRSIMMLAKMLDLEFDMKVVNVMQGEQMKPEFVQLNPQHCLPTVDDDGLVLWESRAILSYLVAAYGKDDSLYPKDVRVRAVVDQRLQFDLGTLYARMSDYFFPTMFMGAPLDETKKAKLVEALGWFDTIIKGNEFAACDHFTIADLALAVTVSQIEAFGFEVAQYHKVMAWLKKCKEHLEPFGYQEINQSGADTLSGIYRSKLQKAND